MTDREAFIRQILTDPTDDTVRLVYADYLEEHATWDADRVRARFIRHQIAEAHHNAHVFYPAHEAMCNEWERRYGSPTMKDPIRPEQCPLHGAEYVRAFNISRLMNTQSRVMLGRYAAEWLGDLPWAILPPEYFTFQDVTALEREPLKIVVRRDDWRDWIEFHAEPPLGTTHPLNSGPLLRFRRGFVSQINYGYFYQIKNEPWLEAVFYTHPIEAVRSSRAPVEIRTLGDEPRWAWSTGSLLQVGEHPNSIMTNALLDSRIWSRLPHCEYVCNRYPTRISAVTDFQWACIALGRELAGLPMLPLPPKPETPNPKATARPRKAQT